MTDKELLETIRYWKFKNPKSRFNMNYVLSVQAQFDCKQMITTKQRTALSSIIEKWKMDRLKDTTAVTNSTPEYNKRCAAAKAK